MPTNKQTGSNTPSKDNERNRNLQSGKQDSNVSRQAGQKDDDNSRGQTLRSGTNDNDRNNTQNRDQ